MAEQEETIFVHGCPAMDLIENSDLSVNNELMEVYSGVGDKIDWEKPYIILIQHPVTTSYGEGFKQIEETLYALREFTDKYQIVALWPNADAGADDVAKGLRMFRENGLAEKFHFYKNFTPEDFLRVLYNSSCAVGNSSSFLREGEYLGVPSVLIGDRQIGREIGPNILFSGYDRFEIKSKISSGLLMDRVGLRGDSIYGEGDAGDKIADTLSTYEFKHIKRLEL